MATQPEPEAVFDSDAASRAVNSMWLTVARAIGQIVSEPGEWIDSPKNAAEAIEFAALAEACFWQATGTNIPARSVREVLGHRDAAALAKIGTPA